MATRMLARMIIPALAVGDPMHHPFGSEPTPVVDTPRDEVQIVNNLCHPLTLKTAQRRITNLGCEIRSVQMSFMHIITGIEASNKLNVLKRYQARHIIRELPTIRSLFLRFKKLVQESREEAVAAVVVISSFNNTILENLNHSNHEALREEIVVIDKAIHKHDGIARRLGDDFTQLGSEIITIGAAIQTCIRREKGKADAQMVEVSKSFDKLGEGVSKCNKSRSIFADTMRGIGQQCIGLIVAAFGADSKLFDDNATLVDIPSSAKGRKTKGLNRSTSVSELSDIKKRSRALSDPLVSEVAQDAEQLQEAGQKVAAIGHLWSALQMDLHKISAWLDMKFDGGKWQGSWNSELFKSSMNTMRQPTRDLIDQLDRYAKFALLEESHVFVYNGK